MVRKKRYKKVYKKRGHASKAALGVRGGFSIPPGLARTVSIKGANLLGTYLAKEAIIRGKKTRSFANVVEMAKKAAETINVIEGGGTIDVSKHYKIARTPAPMNDAIPLKNSSVGSATSEKSRNVSSTGVANTSKVYTTRFVNGTPMSKALRAMKLMNGSKVSTYFDTMSNAPSQGTSTRTSLLQSTGFNQRKFFTTTADTYNTYGSIANLFSLSTKDISDDSMQSVYGMVTKTKNNLTLHNSGTAYPVIVKVHYCTNDPTQSTDGPPGIIQSCINSNITIQQELAVPIRYQFSNLAQNGYIEGADFSLKGSGLWGATEWKARGKVVKSFTKRLSPGDTWKLTEQFDFGSGINLSSLLGAQDNPNVSMSNAFSYWPVVEFHGVQAEAIYNGGATNTFIGTSPSWLSVEASSSVEYILPSTTAADWTGDDGVTDSIPAMKVYTRADNVIKEFNLDVGQIGIGGTQYSIPSISDVFVVDAQQRT